MIHISTDYVFDGKKATPYVESDRVCPLGAYGRSKEAGERKVRAHLPQHIILRTAWVYGVHGHNFVKTMVRLGCEREVIRIVDDQRGCPTYAADIADAILKIAGRIQSGRNVPWGAYHYCGEGITTWYAFAKSIFDCVGKNCDLKVKSVDPIPTADYPTLAQRPANSSLDCTLITKTFGIVPKPWPERLKAMLNQSN
jgi:dTDP-4-dehydrorhamnose reductase